MESFKLSIIVFFLDKKLTKIFIVLGWAFEFRRL